jgi:hypothetical protein
MNAVPNFIVGLVALGAIVHTDGFSPGCTGAEYIWGVCDETHVVTNRSEYTSYFQVGVKQGDDEVFLRDGLSDDDISSEGLIRWAAESAYTGRSPNRKNSGRSAMTLPNSSSVSGNWLANSFYGRGNSNLADARHYVGNFVNSGFPVAGTPLAANARIIYAKSPDQAQSATISRIQAKARSKCESLFKVKYSVIFRDYGGRITVFRLDGTYPPGTHPYGNQYVFRIGVRVDATGLPFQIVKVNCVVSRSGEAVAMHRATTRDFAWANE